jgi:hypothetical protein
MNLSSSVPAPVGRLRLVESLFAVSAVDSSGQPVAPATPLAISVLPSESALASVGGDASQLLIGYLDTSGTWVSAPTVLDASGRLTARVPGPTLLAVFRQAGSFWVVPNADLPLLAADGSQVGTAAAASSVEIVAAQEATYQVRLGDGSIALLDGSQVSNVAAPDALPPLPVALPPAPDASAPAQPETAGVQTGMSQADAPAAPEDDAAVADDTNFALDA